MEASFATDAEIEANASLYRPKTRRCNSCDDDNEATRQL